MRLPKTAALLFVACAVAACGGEETSSSCSLLAGDLVISEVMPNVVGTDDGKEWIELYNASSSPQALDQLELAVAGSGKPKTHTLRSAGSIPAKGYLVLGSGLKGEGVVAYSYGTGISLRDDGATITISCSGTVIDEVKYGDQGGAAAPPEGKSLSFDGGMAPDAQRNDDGALWCSAGDPYDGTNLGTPGAANVLCGAAACDAGGQLRDVVSPGVGDLVINEVFANPAGADAGKEWIELYVTAGASVDLNGLRLEHTNSESGSKRSWTLSGATCLAAEPGAYVVVAASADAEQNGGVPADFVLAELDLYNAAASTLALYRGDTLVDGATLPSFTSEGVSASLAPESASAAGNDSAAAFCSGTRTDVFSGTGTPGSPNGACGGGTVVTTCLDGGGARALVAPQVGDLVITEVLPAAVGADTGKEWFELYVAAAAGVDLNGVVVRDVSSASGNTRTATFTSADCLHVASGTYVTVGASSDTATNGGLTVDVLLAGLSLFDDGSTLELVLGDGTTIESAVLPAATAGVAVGLAPGVLLPEANDSADAFCRQQTTGVFDGKGSPGAANDACDGASSSGATCTDGSGSRAVVSPGAGDLVITEVVADPAGADNYRDWLELYVAASAPVDLNGVTITNAATSTRRWTLTNEGCLSFVPGSFVILAGANAHLDGVVADVTFSGSDSTLLYGTVAATLSLAIGDTTIDTITYAKPTEAKSASLHPSVLEAIGNDEAVNWCVASTSSGGYTGMGSPGLANECP